MAPTPWREGKIHWHESDTLHSFFLSGICQIASCIGPRIGEMNRAFCSLTMLEIQKLEFRATKIGKFWGAKVPWRQEAPKSELNIKCCVSFQNICWFLSGIGYTAEKSTVWQLRGWGTKWSFQQPQVLGTYIEVQCQPGRSPGLPSFHLGTLKGSILGERMNQKESNLYKA